MLTKHIAIKQNDGLYFPLFNLKGLKSSITPFLGGDLKLDHHHYVLEPTSDLSMYQLQMSRNIIVSVNDKDYFANGQKDYQQHDQLEATYGLLHQHIRRVSDEIMFDITSFVPENDTVELHEVKLTNPTNHKINIRVTTAIPLFARSADNLRDHRHVTSLLTRITCLSNGIINHPTLSFDERGHKENPYVYSVFAKSDAMDIHGFIPTIDQFIKGGSLTYPRGLNDVVQEGYRINGYEAMGAVQFEEKTLQPGESVTLYLSIGIHTNHEDANHSLSHLNKEAFHKELEETQKFFNHYTQGLSFHMTDAAVSETLSWAVIQPMLRRYFGNSYLPHHDYGRGGKGWRDLWQDLLALIMMNDDSVKELLYNNFLGVRVDGSNATIIGDLPGEFKADRNMITRVWSDHGAWPLLTVQMYLDETGDKDFLLRKQGYFQDQFTHYTKKTRPYQGNRVLTSDGTVYEGTILEHLLLQNLVGHHNIGKNGFVKLEDADWNDGLDMAHHLGETIAFTHMYADNLRKIASMIEALNVLHIEIFHELKDLLQEDASLTNYFDVVSHFEGKKVMLKTDDVINSLRKLADRRIEHLRKHAFKQHRYQSYFNNDGLDPDHGDHVNLTGQAMALLSKTPSQEQAIEMVSFTKSKLYEISVGGYHLNTNQHHVLTNMGRAYGFAYGHKENGAVFSHMVMMYAYGLYQYDFIHEGREAWLTLIKQALKAEGKVLVGIPEYFNDQGVGMYPFLTGSASWLLKLMRTEVFGIQMRLGKLYLEPKLTQKDFIDGKASIQTYLFGHIRSITYHNPKGLDVGSYKVSSIKVNQKMVEQGITSLDGHVEVMLDEIR